MNVIRWYNQNRRMIWIVILTIIGVIGILQALNRYYENNAKDESSTNSTTFNTNYSVISQHKVDEDVSKKSVNLIETFFELCNAKKIEEAYNLLSTDCKEELYPTINDFITKYYNRIFLENKTYSSKLWITTSTRNTYRVEIMNDILSTGEKDYMPIEDYYTITNENGIYKLNISNFIRKQDINESKTKENFIVTIVSKRIYMDYEIYEIKIQNNSTSKIIFNTKEHSDSIFLVDENELKYIAFLNELPNSELEILAGTVKTIEIKFNRGYKPNINIEKIVFNDINNNNIVESIEIEI